MFRRLSEPLPLSEASLLLLRPALNAPVLNVGYLPVGPARAAVVAFGEEYGGIGIALGVRSNESGQLAVLRNQESIDFDVPLAEALEPLLAVAERMGFLFDEDIFQVAPGQRGRVQAMAHWAELMGGMESLLPAPSADADDPRSSEEDDTAGPLSPSLAVAEMQYPELMLDDVAPFVLGEDELSFASGSEETLDTDLDDDFDDVLDDEFEDELEHEGDDRDLDDAVLGESDLTEPTTPILAMREKPFPLPTVARVAAGAAARSRARSLSAPRDDERPALAKPSSPAVAPAPENPPAPLLAAATPPALPRVLLSKFRNAEGTAEVARARAGKSEVGADRSAELARIPIVRVRREREAGKRVPFLARLLSSF